jgi:hypothetical protein
MKGVCFRKEWILYWILLVIIYNTIGFVGAENIEYKESEQNLFQISEKELITRREFIKQNILHAWNGYKVRFKEISN